MKLRLQDTPAEVAEATRSDPTRWRADLRVRQLPARQVPARSHHRLGEAGG